MGSHPKLGLWLGLIALALGVGAVVLAAWASFTSVEEVTTHEAEEREISVGPISIRLGRDDEAERETEVRARPLTPAEQRPFRVASAALAGLALLLGLGSGVVRRELYLPAAAACLGAVALAWDYVVIAIAVVILVVLLAVLADAFG